MRIRSVLSGVGASIALVCAPMAHAQSGTAAISSGIASSIGGQEVAGVKVPDSDLATDAEQALHSAAGDLVFQHSMRVFYWAALAGKRKGLTYDPEFLFVAAMFHDYGLTHAYDASHRRYEVDGADAARAFLLAHGASEADAQGVWLAIALHTTNGVSPHLFPVASLLAEAANMDLVGVGYNDFTPLQRDAVQAAHPREPRFADDFMQALYDGLKHRPETTQGTGLADVMAYKDPQFPLRNFSSLMLASPWVPQTSARSGTGDPRQANFEGDSQ